MTREALAALLDEIEADPSLARRVRRLLRVVATATEPAYLSRSHYAARIDVSPRCLDQLLARGLPAIGAGKLRRIPVAEADAWLRQHLDDEETTSAPAADPIERLARANAQRGARKPGRP